MGTTLSLSVSGDDGASDEFPMHVITRFAARDGGGAAEALRRALVDASVVERTRASGGCRFVALLQGTERASEFVLVEVFSDYDTLSAHAASPVREAFEAAVKPHCDAGVRRDVFMAMAEQHLISYARGFTRPRMSDRDSVFCLTEFASGDLHAASLLRKAATESRLVECSRAEPGVLYYTIAQHVEDKKRFVIVEQYRDHKAFDVHTDTENLKSAIDAMSAHIDGRPRHTTYSYAG